MSMSRRAAAVVVVAVAMFGVVACSPAEPGPSVSSAPVPSPTGTASVIATPSYYWMGGIEPTSPLEDHPLVQTLRGADLGYPMAWNTGDFTTEQLTDYVTTDAIAWMAQDYSRQGDDPRVVKTFSPWQPMEILRYDDTGGEVLVCWLDSSGEWSPGEPVENIYDRSGALHFRLTVLKENGELKVKIGDWRDVDGNPDNEPCDPATIPVAVFDPAPVPPTPPVTAPVRPPLFPGWETM